MSYGQPFWRIAQPQFSSQSAKEDLAQIMDTFVLIFNKCVDRNVQLQLEAGTEKTKEQVSCDLKEFCRAGIFNISRVYKYNFSRQIDRLDFNNVVTQWGYMYVNMCRHIHLVYHVMSTALRQNRITVHSKKKTSICAIGAGPGSDVLGLLMFFREAGIRFPFSKINLLDRCVAWNDSWRSLIEKLPKDMSGALGECNYHHFDFFNDELTDKLRRVINKATFVTFVKSINSVSARLRGKQFYYQHRNGQPPRGHWHSIYSILQCMQPGAIVLFIDKGTSQMNVNRNILMDSALLLGFQVLYENNLTAFRMPCSFSKSCNEFIKYMNYRPCSVAGQYDTLLLWKPNRRY